MRGYRTLDLNMFYKEFYTKELGTWWDDKLTIEVYIREEDDEGIRNIETGVLIKCDFYETKWLADQFPMDEYGSDWWVFANEVKIPTRRIGKILKGIDLGERRPGALALNYI